MLKKLIAGIGVLLVLIGIVFAQQTRPATSRPVPDLVAHGKYLVHHVAMCVECHTPRDPRGDLIRNKLLQGAPVPVSSPFPGQEWCFETPEIAVLPGWADEDAVRFLMTGLDARGYRARPPMPQFRFNHEDARAVVAYLRTLQQD
jgi:mono/diheme cytochrome c family protein